MHAMDQRDIKLSKCIRYKRDGRKLVEFAEFDHR